MLLTALKVLQNIDGALWRVPSLGSYSAMLVIDVGHNRRHYSMSLLVARPPGDTPDFGIYTKVYPKADHDKEEVNDQVLEKDFFDFVNHEIGGFNGQLTPLADLLILRDGKLFPRENCALDRAFQKLIDKGLFARDFRRDFAAFYKNSLKSIRFWEVSESSNKARNAEVGTAILLNSQMVVVGNTGRETLNQGTVEPVVIEANGENFCLSNAATAVHSSAQLNWSSPTVAQRLSLPFKRTDDELKSKKQQESRLIK